MSCQEIIVPCFAVAQVEGPKELEYETYRTQKTWTTRNGGKIGSGKLRRQENLIAALTDKEKPIIDEMRVGTKRGPP